MGGYLYYAVISCLSSARVFLAVLRRAFKSSCSINSLYGTTRRAHRRRRPLTSKRRKSVGKSEPKQHGSKNPMPDEVEYFKKCDPNVPRLKPISHSDYLGGTGWFPIGTFL